MEKQGLQLLRLPPRQPRGDDPRHVRQHPAAQPAARRRVAAATPATSPRTAAPQAFIYDAAQNYADAGIPLVVLGGKEYGSGSSRDWAAKGTALLGRQGRDRRVATSGSTAPTSSAWACCRCSSRRARRPSRWASTAPRPSTSRASPRSTTAPPRARCTSPPPRTDGETGRVRRGRPHRHPRRGRLLPQRRDPAVRAAGHARVALPFFLLGDRPRAVRRRR